MNLQSHKCAPLSLSNDIKGTRPIDYWFCNGMQTHNAFLAPTKKKQHRSFGMGLKWTHKQKLKLKSTYTNQVKDDN
jgi:hypothetical protein